MSAAGIRPMADTLEGYAWLPRMIDTARAARAGTLGSLMYPCPIDRRCQSLLGIGAASFDAVAYEHELRSRRESHQSVRVDAQETTIGTRRGR